MGKPWARIEIGYLSHPKFTWLNANAICLWHEGKQYCDMHHTDGLIPTSAFKRFRFRGMVSVRQLMTSCGRKADGTPYAPLWTVHPSGYQMHDYLDHNPCREETLARIAMVDAKRDSDRSRMREKRRVADESRATCRARLSLTVAGDGSLNVAGTEENSTEENRKEEERTPLPPLAPCDVPLDVWFVELKASYPPQAVTSGARTEHAWCEIFQRDLRPASVIWAEIRANLENQKAGYQWRVKRMIPKLETWLRDGLWQQQHEAHPPVTVSEKTAGTLGAAAQILRGES